MKLPTPEDRKWIEDNIINLEQVRLNFIANGAPLHRWELIYKRYIGNIILTTWCSACVMDMMRSIVKWWDKVKDAHE